MRPPSTSVDSELYDRSRSSSGGQTSAKAVYKQRQEYGKAADASSEVSEYRVAVIYNVLFYKN